MSDFASSAMLRVLHAGMRRLGLESPAQAWLQSATVPLDAKRQLVGQVLAQRGWLGVLRLGEGVEELQGEVLMDYLAASADPNHILQAWLRLERYVHSRHRMRITHLSERHIQMHHYSLIEGQAPSAAEDVVVLGVLLGLLQRCGLQDLRFTWEPSLGWWEWGHIGRSQEALAGLQHALQTAQTAHWQMQWTDVIERSNTAPAQFQFDRTSMPGLWSAKVAEWVVQQLVQSRVELISLSQAALSLHLSERSLQRNLRAEGLRFVDVLGQARVNLAARLLKQSSSALAEVGFSSGFADQAHFCREFKRRVGMSPLHFRECVQSRS
jgi:AraC-like DNA-binding protein